MNDLPLFEYAPARKPAVLPRDSRARWERMRWTFTVETQRPEGEPKLNDHYTSWYARHIMATKPDLAGFFEVRGSKEGEQ
jgi:hypothetical protein